MHFLPETGYRAHAGGMCLGQRLLDDLGVLVDVYSDAGVEAEIGPCLLKDVAEGKEAYRRVLVGQARQPLVVQAQAGVEA